jgi:hypothetical protein
MLPIFSMVDGLSWQHAYLWDLANPLFGRRHALIILNRVIIDFFYRMNAGNDLFFFDQSF